MYAPEGKSSHGKMSGPIGVDRSSVAMAKDQSEGLELSEREEVQRSDGKRGDSTLFGTAIAFIV